MESDSLADYRAASASKGVAKKTGLSFSFRRHLEQDAAQPAPGQLYLWLPDQHARRHLAEWVLAHRTEGLPRGTGPVTELVLQAHPTLDDMLAAALLERRLTGQPWPETMGDFARYAGLWHDGLRPGEAPLEKSLGGVYLAVLNDPEEDLTLPEGAERFLKAWRRLEAHIFQAAEQGRNPFTDSLFPEHGDFALQMAFLKKDRDVYRQDVGRGESWRGRIPGVPRIASCLLLRQPKSLLFRDWRLEDEQSPTGDGYLLLAVHWKAGEWVFSTDPVQKLSLQPLAEVLQAAEAELDSGRAAKDPWFEGRPFAHTLVASPRQGALLPDKKVLQIVRRWTRQRWLDSPESRYKALAAACGGLVLVLLVMLAAIPSRPAPLIPHPVEVVYRDDGAPSVVFNGQPLERGLRRVESPGGRGISGVELEVVLKAAEGSRPSQNRVTFPISKGYALPWPAVLEVHCRASGRRAQPQDLEVQLNEDPTTRLVAANRGTEVAASVLLAPGRNTIDVYVANPHREPLPVKLEVRWRPDESQPPELHLLTVGVSDYQLHAKLGVAHKDAQDIARYFEKHRGKYARTTVHGVLTDGDASRNKLLDTLKFIRDQVRTRPQDLFLLTLSGHGEKENGRYYFLPWDYDPDASRAWAARNAISWNDLVADLPRNCRVIIILDTCHAGQVTSHDLLRWLDEPGSERVVIAAARSTEAAFEDRAWGNGLFTLSFLEALTGKPHHAFPPPTMALPPDLDDDGVLTLREVLVYVEMRVKQLSTQRNRPQSVTYSHVGEVDYLKIPLAVVSQ